jgi:hypothetical protein
MPDHGHEPGAPARSTIVPFVRLISGRMAATSDTDQRWPLLTATHGTGHQGRIRENARAWLDSRRGRLSGRYQPAGYDYRCWRMRTHTQRT